MKLYANCLKRPWKEGQREIKIIKIAARRERDWGIFAPIFYGRYQINLNGGANER